MIATHNNPKSAAKAAILKTQLSLHFLFSFSRSSTAPFDNENLLVEKTTSLETVTLKNEQTYPIEQLVFGAGLLPSPSHSQAAGCPLAHSVTKRGNYVALHFLFFLFKFISCFYLGTKRDHFIAGLREVG